MSATPTPEDHLSRFGLTAFRAGQHEVISAVMDGLDCLCIMPTGGGKSLCYQLPSVAREGTTLVVSPLIALMKDQVDGLNKMGIEAAFINSSLSAAEQDERLLRFSEGAYDMLYVAPERFRSPRFSEAAKRANLQLLAVDEAHCISEWGHDFRHDYARLGEFRERLGNPQTIALTATATADVQEDVVKQLNLKAPETFVAGFARDNLFYRVENHRGKQAKHQALLKFVERTEGCGIIYCSTRASCEEVRELVHSELGRGIIAYHGGLMADDRRRRQEAFMDGEAEIVAATNAFGMGIDKSNVRFVLHYNIPGSLEAYYQEAGRAGRDGDPSECLMLYSQSDRFIQEFFIDSAHPPKESIKQVYDYLCRHPDDPIELTQQELKENIGLAIGADGVGTCERMLEKAGVLERLDSNHNMAAVRIESDAPNLAELLPVQAKAQRRIARAVGNIVSEQRYERVYFHPRDICTLSGDDAPSVARALRELTRHDWFDYVPPFRGRAVHMLRRDLRFEQLDIDYTRLEQRRQSNLAKLDRVVRFATTRKCRQSDILQYFGEATQDKCGHCDNCVASPSKPEPSGKRAKKETTEVSPAMIQVTRMVLSGVARAQGRFGKMLVVGMLCGSQSAKIKKWKLDQLSTFGLLDCLNQNEVTEIVDTLIAYSLIKLVEVDKFRPTIHNTDLGRNVMLDREQLAEPLDLDPALLRKVERRFGGSKQSTGPPKSTQPQSDAAETEEVTADSPPVTVDKKAGANDDEVDSSLNGADGRTDNRESVELRPVTAPNEAPRGEENAHYWTWRLLNDGYSAAECEAIRGRLPTELCRDLLQAQQDGLSVNPGWLLTDGQLDWLNNNVSLDQEVRPLSDNLPDGLTTELVTLYKKCRGQYPSQRKSRA